jgi:hydroxypyruvate isomerase
MPKFAANLHYLFTEAPFLDRFEAAARAGFKGVEFQVPYDYPAQELRARLDSHGLTMVLFDGPMGDWQRGDRGLAAVPGREAEFRHSLGRVVEYGEALGCDTVHLMAGVVEHGEALVEARRVYIANLRHACRLLEPYRMHVVIEPINNRMGTVSDGPSYTTRGMHGYFLNYTHQARSVIEEVGADNLSLHLDVYHMQLLEGHLADTIREHIGLVRHFQIAGVPGRHEPDVGEIHYPFLFELIDSLGYGRWIGCEYRPKGNTWQGLGWASAYGIHASGGPSSGV